MEPVTDQVSHGGPRAMHREPARGGLPDPFVAQKPWIVPIPGTIQMAHRLENIGAVEVRFTPSELSDVASHQARVTFCKFRYVQCDLQHGFSQCCCSPRAAAEVLTAE